MLTQTAGHETTASLLSFLFYHLLRNPDTYEKAQAEVDAVVGRQKLTLDHISKLPYVTGVIRETLRINPTGSAFSLRAHPTLNHENPVTLGGRYVFDRRFPIFVLTAAAHSDPEVWGSDASKFEPERMMGEAFEALPKNAWKVCGI